VKDAGKYPIIAELTQEFGFITALPVQYCKPSSTPGVGKIVVQDVLPHGK
jgi:hypothetical protein